MNDIKIPDTKKPHVMEGMKPEMHDMKSTEPGEKIKVNFSKFVQLVASHDFEDVLKKHAHEDIILSTNLLTDLANSHEEVVIEKPKSPLFLILGIVIGVVVTYILVRL